MQFKNILAVVAISAATSAVSVSIYGHLINKQNHRQADTLQTPVHFTNYAGDGDGGGAPADFTKAATLCAPAVVHVQTSTSAKQVRLRQDELDPFAQFFGDDGRRIIPGQKGSGSGVILSEDGYIVTNNHVIANADKVTVTLANHKTYNATIVGTDAKADLAVLKIDARNLPFLLYGNIEDVNLGQWVLAIGYPWNLDITVTAGIVSAKTRTIATAENPDKGETYIQTDAAVNLGNSGGALINTNGELVGINSALTSPTGTYAGYSYAIPVNIVKQKVNDIIRGATVKGSKS